MIPFETRRKSILGMSNDLRRELGEIAASLRGLRFGSVHIIVQDGVVIQIDRTEKLRVPRPASRDHQR